MTDDERARLLHGCAWALAIELHAVLVVWAIVRALS